MWFLLWSRVTWTWDFVGSIHSTVLLWFHQCLAFPGSVIMLESENCFVTVLYFSGTSWGWETSLSNCPQLHQSVLETVSSLLEFRCLYPFSCLWSNSSLPSKSFLSTQPSHLVEPFLFHLRTFTTFSHQVPSGALLFWLVWQYPTFTAYHLTQRRPQWGSLVCSLGKSVHSVKPFSSFGSVCLWPCRSCWLAWNEFM